MIGHIYLKTIYVLTYMVFKYILFIGNGVIVQTNTYIEVKKVHLNC